MKYYIEDIHIDYIRGGDVILRDGKLITLCNKDIKRGGFLGTTVMGDSYYSGHKPVKLARIFNGIPDGLEYPLTFI